MENPLFNSPNHPMNPITKPPFEVFPVVANETITLREIQYSDIPDLREISFYNAIPAKTVEEAAEMNSKITKDYKAGNSIHWGIVENKSGKMVGTCGYYRGFEQGAGELGCVLLSQYRGQGLMNSALELAITFGLQTMNLKRIWAATTPQNKKAIQLLERLGLKKTRDTEDGEVEFELVIT